MYVKINKNGQWMDIKISDAEVKKVMTETFEKTKKIVEKVEKECKDLPAEQKAVISAQLVRHVHYNLEELAKEKAYAETGTSKDDAPDWE